MPTSMTPAHVPTAPGGLPLLGHALRLYREPLRFMESLRQHGPIVRVRLGTGDAYLLTAPDLVHQLLVMGDDKVDKGRLFDRARPIFGDGLAVSTGEVHRRQRRLVQPAFLRSRIDNYVDTMRAGAAATTSAWTSGQEVDLGRALNDLALSIAAQALFTTRPGSDTAAEVARYIPDINAGTASLALLPTWWRRLPTSGNRRFREATRRLRATVDDAVRRYRQGDGSPDDVLSVLLTAREEGGGESMSDSLVHDEVVTLMLAGTETTRAVLCAAFHELGRRPEVAERLYAELDTVLAGDPVGAADVSRLDYTGRFLTEVLRRYPFWLLTRRTLTPTELGGAELPAGTELLYSPYLLHHDPSLFPDPEHFDPDRWLPGSGAKPPRGAFIPFGNGIHRCIGDNFAIVEATVVLATIASRWRLEPLPGEEPRLVVAGGPVYPGPLRMRAMARTGTAAGPAHGVRPAECPSLPGELSLNRENGESVELNGRADIT